MDADPQHKPKEFQSFLDARIGSDVAFADFITALDQALANDPSYLGVVVPPSMPSPASTNSAIRVLTYQILRNADINKIDAESLQAAVRTINATVTQKTFPFRFEQRIVDISPEYFKSREYWTPLSQRVIDQFVSLSRRCVGAKIRELREILRRNLWDNFDLEPENRKEALERILTNLNSVDKALALTGYGGIEDLPPDRRRQLEERLEENAVRVKTLWA